MDAEIQNKLKTTVFIKSPESSGLSGCINSGSVYQTDSGNVFVKENSKKGASTMFEGEYYGLLELYGGPVRVPKPLLHGKTYLVLEYLDISSLSRFAEELGESLAKLHKGCNVDSQRVSKQDNNVRKFGFDRTTCCGFLPLINDWQDDWTLFYASQRIQPQVVQIQEKYGDRKIGELWSMLQTKLAGFFKDIKVTPSLLHGDLWSGNAAETENGPVIYDPAVFYGHDEFDLAIARMFGGFPQSFYSAYHRVLPQQLGFKKRQDLYILFHQLNHWNHFGSGYKQSSLALMRELAS